MQTTTKNVPARGLRLGVDAEPAPQLWSFRRAERGELAIGPDGLFFGAWSIPRLAVVEAHWFIAREMQIPLVAILRVRTQSDVFELSVEPWTLSSSDLPFAVERVEFSILSHRAKLLLLCSVVAVVVGFTIAG